MSKYDTGGPPMRHTVKLGLVCAALSGVLFPLMAGIGIGYGVGKETARHCTVTK